MVARMLQMVWLGLTITPLVLTGCGHGCGHCSGGVNSDASGVLAANTNAEAGTPLQAAPAAPTAVATTRPYGGQKTCPVMGNELGAMGSPIPVNVLGDTVFVCCRGCVSKLQRDPDRYLAKVMAERAGQSQ
jgi:hypothetical protein